MHLSFRLSQSLPILAACLALSLGSMLEAKSRWFRMQTEHCEIYSCTSESETIDIAERLEYFRTGILKMTQMRPAYEPPLVMVIFDNEKQMRPYAPLYQGKPKEVAGVFAHGPGEAAIMLYSSTNRDATMRTVGHEYVHFLVRTRGLVLPVWLNEGLAELFEAMQISKKELEFGYGPSGHMATLRRESLMPLDNLFAVGHESKEYGEGQLRSLFYAQSWALVHYWMCGESQDKVQKFLDFTNSLLGENAATDEAFEKAFGMDFAAMKKELDRYLRNGRFVVRRLKLDLPDIRASLKSQPVSDEERDAVLSFLEWRMKRSEGVGIKLLQLAEKTPDNPRPYEFLGMIEQSKNERAYAQDYFRKAYDLGSRKPWLMYELAAEVDRQLRSGFSLDYRMPEELSAEMRTWLDQTLAAAPHHSKALEILAMVEAFSQTPRPEVINRLQNSITLTEDRRRFLLMLAAVRWRVDDEATCRKILKLLISLPVPARRTPRQPGQTLDSIGQRINVPLGAPHGAVAPVRAPMDQTLSLARQLQKRLDAQAAKKAKQKLEQAPLPQSSEP